MPECTEYCCRYNRKNLFCAYIYLRIAHLLSCPPGRKSCLWCVQYALLLCYFVISRSFSEAEVNFMEDSSQSKCKVRSVNMLVLLCSSLCGLNFLMCWWKLCGVQPANLGKHVWWWLFSRDSYPWYNPLWLTGLKTLASQRLQVRLFKLFHWPWHFNATRSLERQQCKPYFLCKFCMCVFHLQEDGWLGTKCWGWEVLGGVEGVWVELF